jgi:hypothetical protein
MHNPHSVLFWDRLKSFGIIIALIFVFILSIALVPQYAILAFLVFIVIVPVNLSKQIANKLYKRPVVEDTRDPILYLRSFSDDDKLNLLDIFISVGAFETSEQMLCKLASKLGPVIAIGRPHEVLPALGARRFYISDEEWRHEISYLLQIARIIIVRIGYTSGLEWEIEAIARLCDPQRVIIYCPFPYQEKKNASWRAVYLTFAGLANKYFPRQLPSDDDVGEIITFSDDWKPISRELKLNAFNFIRFKACETRFTYIREYMKPIFNHLNTKIPKLFSIKEIIFIIFFLLFRCLGLMFAVPSFLLYAYFHGLIHGTTEGFMSIFFAIVCLFNFWGNFVGYWRQ